MTAEDIYTYRIEESAESLFAECYDAGEACNKIRDLMQNDPKWNRRINLYMEINFIDSRAALYKEVRNRYAEFEAESEQVWNDFFPNRDDDDDGMEDFPTDDD